MSASALNRFGLARDIPSDVAREVRQRSGFGCVRCGDAVYDYDHFDPEFVDATTHSASGITLLCSGCHGLKTRGLLSLESVRAAVANPRPKQHGFSFGPFDVGGTHPDIVLGTVKAIRTQTILRAFGRDVLAVAPPEDSGAPFNLSAYFTDEDGKHTLAINRNEWRTPTDNWDVEVVGRRITVRKKLGAIALRLRSDPPHVLVVERLNMYYEGAHFFAREGQTLRVTLPSGGVLESGGAVTTECATAIEVSNSQILIGVECKGGTSIETLSVGSRKSTRRDISIKGAARNLPCPCGSGRKAKKCHAA